MAFEGNGVPLTPEAIDRVCAALGVGPVEVWTVLTVETRGFGFLPDRRPQILFERHVFHELTDGRFDAVDSSISNPKSGGHVGGTGEYPRLERAMSLDRAAALKSASWGIGQVMGFNHKVAGFATVDDMVAATVQDETSQLLAMASFIDGTGLAGALRRQDWEQFARGYNGPDFKKHDYDVRLANAHAALTEDVPDLRLRSAQAALLYVGFDPGPIDGVLGNRTRRALQDFQRGNGQPETGDLDSGTEALLLALAFPLVSDNVR